MKYSLKMVMFFTLLTGSLSVVAQPAIELSLLGTHKSGLYNVGGSEIVTFDPILKKIFVVNAVNNAVTVLDATNPSSPDSIASISMASYGAGINSVSYSNGMIAVAVEAAIKQDAGQVVLLSSSDYSVLGTFPSGALPDMVTFSNDGKYVLVANEGEPNDAYTNDPEGSVSIIDLTSGVESATVSTVDFNDFNIGGSRRSEIDTTKIRVFGPNASLSQDFEPEYITVEGDSAYVSIQEANALVLIQISTAEIVWIKPFGFKDFSLSENSLDISDRDVNFPSSGSSGKINFGTYPLLGMYMPDAIAHHSINNQLYLFTANEGDTRAYTGYNEEVRVSTLTLDSTNFPSYATLKLNQNMGRLTVTKANGDNDKDGKYDTLFAFGARSFSIWSADGNLVWDSKNDFETKLASIYPVNFNASHTSNALDGRSTSKGPEPEAVAVGQVGDSIYAFIGLERIGGIMVYNVTNPNSPYFIQYINNRDFSKTPGTGTVNTIGDLGIECIVFVPADKSPNGKALLLTGNEISGTTTIFEITETLTVPVELVSFHISGNTLIWKTATESNNSGWEIETKEKGSRVQGSWKKIGFVAGKGTTTEAQTYTFSVSNLKSSDSEFEVRLKQIDIDGKFSYSNVLTVNPVPTHFDLIGNYPNPFNPTTKISYQLSAGSKVELKIYDLLGREIKTLVNGNIEAGKHSVEFSAADFPSGVYFYKLTAGSFTQTKKMTLMK